jgi:divinyl protochlorophyllide a 8-vinyl-reductase
MEAQHPLASPANVARIGPNAILQTIAVLDRHEGRATRDRVMRIARVAVPPPDAGMLPESDCRAVHLALRQELGDRAEAILRLAGLATGDYILAHRIPGPAQLLIRALPRRWGARLLATAIARHAWTFVGSGLFRIVAYRPLVFELAGTSLASGHAACVWHAAVFERLFARLVWPHVVVEHAESAPIGAGVHRLVLHPDSASASISGMSAKTVRQS